MSFLASFVAGRTLLSRATPQGILPQQVAAVYRLASSSGGIIGNSNTAIVTCAATEDTQGPINGSNSTLLFRLHSTYTKGDDKAPHRWVDDQDKRARAQESVYFKKEDEKLLRKLLNKVKVEADHHDQQEAEIHAKDERAALQKIVGKYNVSEEDLEAILHWRHHEPVH